MYSYVCLDFSRVRNELVNPSIPKILVKISHLLMGLLRTTQCVTSSLSLVNGSLIVISPSVSLGTAAACSFSTSLGGPSSV